VRQCSNLDTSRIRALYALELGRVADRLGTETISVTCGSSETRLKVESSRMGWIERVLRTSLEGAEAERIVALAAAQLVLAAWVEAPRDRPLASTYAPSPTAPEAPASNSTAQPVATVDAEVDVGIHARPLDKLVMGPTVGLSGMAWRGAWGALLGIGVDRVTSARPLGNVELMVGEIELSPAWRSSSARPFSLELTAGPALAFVQLRGIEPAASVRTGAISAVTLDAKARAALRYRGGGFSLRAAVDGGYLVSGVEGIVSADTMVVARGAWVGFTVSGGATW
jgi:hypothetical protein